MTRSLARFDLSLRELAFRVRRRLAGERPLFDFADRTWEVAPAVSVSHGPSLFLAGQLDKVRALEPNTTWDTENRRAFGGVFEHAPIVAYEFRGAALYRGSVLAHGRARRIVPFGVEPAPSADFPVIDIKEGALAGSYLGLRYFGHWVMDDAPLSLLASDYGEAISPTLPVWHESMRKHDHVANYARFLDLPCRIAENVRFERLTVFDDEYVTRHKAARLEELRRRAGARLGAAPAPVRAFIKRGVVDDRMRNFVNEDAVARALAGEGFRIVDPAGMSVEEIASALHGVELVVGAEGSQLMHSIFFLPPGGGFLAITPPERFCTVNKRLTDLLGLRYAFMVGDAGDAGFTANMDDLKRTIELLG